MSCAMSRFDRVLLNNTLNVLAANHPIGQIIVLYYTLIPNSNQLLYQGVCSCKDLWFVLYYKLIPNSNQLLYYGVCSCKDIWFIVTCTHRWLWSSMYLIKERYKKREACILMPADML